MYFKDSYVGREMGKAIFASDLNGEEERKANIKA